MGFSAAEVRMSVVGEMTQNINGTLRTVKSELASTRAEIAKTVAAENDYAAVNEKFAQARARRTRVELDANEAQAQARRDAVTAARDAKAATGATDKHGGAVDRLSTGLGKAARFQEGFNKVIGLAGFAGAAIAAAAGVVQLISGVGSYSGLIQHVKEHQADFNATLRETIAINAEEHEAWLRAHSDKAELFRLEQQKRGNEILTNRIKLTSDLGVLEMALQRSKNQQVLAQLEILKLEGKVGPNWYAQKMQAEGRLNDAKKDEVELTQQIASATGHAATAQGHLERFAVLANPAMQGLVQLSQQLATQLSMAVTPFGALLKMGETTSRFAKPKGGGGGPTQAEKLRDLRAELASTQALTDEDRLQVEFSATLARIDGDRQRKRISADERELKIKIESAKYAKALADIDKESSEKADERGERMQAMRDEVALIGVKNGERRREIEIAQELARINRQLRRGEIDEGEARLARSAAQRRKDEEKRLEALDETAKRYGKVTSAARATAPALTRLNAGFGAVAEGIGGTTEEWGRYEIGQQSLGQTVAGSLGKMGAAVGGAIKDKKAQALVEGGFETAASIASFAAYDYPAGIQHGVAAAAFFGVAAAAGGGSSSGGGSRGSGAAGRAQPLGPANDNVSSSARPSDTRTLVMVQFNRGIVVGLGSDVGKAVAGTTSSLRRTGMGERRF